ncbi:hypothetical protein Taro_015934 [Colocasia esculenta]|uniref:Aminotransferase-like plant mobile domain-containing protein n=1 Tax=Colocasia esculenta TaxID=4460 RepID=A0A843UUR9_COLES|nr:hypothetical protein [Colocasia esculenta]
METPLVEEEVDVALMAVEEEEEAPIVNAEDERRKRAKAMKSPDPPLHGVAMGWVVATLSWRPRQTWPYHSLGRRRDMVAVPRVGEMRAPVSWLIVLAIYLEFPPFQRERVEEMGFGEILGMERMRADPALTQALRSRWDAEATAFAFPWGHMIPSLEDVSRIIGLRTYGRPESLGLFDVGKVAGESDQEHLDKLTRVSRRELASEPGAQADLDLRRFLMLFLGRLLFATRGDAVHCRFLPLLADLGEVGGYAQGAAFLAHQFDSLGASERQTSTSWFFPFLQVWSYLHLPALGRGELTRSGLVPIVRRWDPILDSRSLGDQLERLQEAIDGYPYLDVVWQPYLGEGDEGQPWLVQARPYFALTRASAKEQINNWENKGKAVKSTATTDDAYLQAYGGKVYKSARHQVDITGEIASLRALLYSAVQDREAAHRQTAELRRELERVRGTGAGGASSSRGAGGSPSLLEAQLAGVVLRAEEAQRHLEERERDLQLTTEHAMDLQGERDRLRGEVQTTRIERDQLRIRAEAVEA